MLDGRQVVRLQYVLHAVVYIVALDVRWTSAAEKTAIDELPRILEDYDWAAQPIQRVERSQRPTLLDMALQVSAREGLNAMTELYGKIEPNLLKHGQVLAENHPATLLSKFSAPNEDAGNREMAAYATISATKAFRKNYKFLNELARQSHTPKISLRRTALESLCPPRDAPPCMPASDRYRTHDGTCNNKRRLRWGAAQMPFNRFLPPDYEDGVDSIRHSVDGGALSSSRFVSLLVHGAKEGEASLTLMTVQWGQLLDHDMTSTAQPRSINGSVPSCCGGKDFHPSCFPIKVPLDDPWLAPLKVRCLEFLRSAPAQRRDCVLSWREQTNQATSFIDASPIYSNNARLSDNARVFRNGLLVFGKGNPNDDVCQRGAFATHCIRAGDGRSGEQPGLLALHHVWVGEHNRIAMQLSEMNLHWSDEKLFQETRRIIGAMFQHITYREFLPIILGREVCKLFDLDLLNTGFYQGYDVKVNPTVANSFAAAAFRFGHSLVQNSYMRCDRNHAVINNNVSLHEEFQRGDVGSAGSLHRLIRGMATQRALKRDEFITPELTNHLFQTPGFPFGLDLAAINIQRGRDHGVPPYTSWRTPCGLTAIKTWEDFANVVGPESAQRIGHAYRSVHDIDLFVAGIAERPVVGGLVGPTFACIIAQQFSNSRRGDRFWYENGGFESSFTPAQLHSMRRVSFAQVLCRAVGGGTFQPHIFIPPELPGNERLPCGNGPLEAIDLSPWLEQDPFAEHSAEEPTFEEHLPDKVFNIIPIEALNHAHSSIHILKENKSDPAERVTNANEATLGPATTEASSRRPSNMTRINDKLDLRRKPTIPKRQTPKPIAGVHNKLDKGQSQGLTLASHNKNANRQKVPTTTRRTVIVNNIPIELKSTDGLQTNTPSIPLLGPVKSSRPGVKKRKKTGQNKTVVSKTDKLLPRTRDQGANLIAPLSDLAKNQDLSEKEFSLATHPASLKEHTDIQTTSDDSEDLKNNALAEHSAVNIGDVDIVPPKNLEHPKTNRKRGPRASKLLTMERQNESLIESNENEKLVQQKIGPETTSNITSRSAQMEVFISHTTTTTKFPAIQKTTMDNAQLRHYSTIQDRPIYSRPHKVVLDGPNADQYEIEINIRQTNKGPTGRPNPNYNEYTTAYKPYGYEYPYSPNFVDYTTTATPSYGYYQSPSTITSNLVQPPKTRPPTIIYLNEREEHTTKQPNFLQNIFTFAQNGLSSVQRPFSQPSLTHDNKDTGVTHSQRPISISQSQYPISASHGYGQHQESHLGAGIVHAGVISSSNYGSISTSIASSNAADSTFSFNIRHKPEYMNRPEYPQSGLVTSNSDADRYGLYSSHKQPANYGSLNQQTANTPFSTTNHRPYHNYYNRHHNLPALKEDGTIGNSPSVHTHKLDVTDYDYVSRTLMAETLKNQTNEEMDDVSDYDYDDDTADDQTPTDGKKFNRDGYLRPEHMTGILLKTITNNKTNNADRNNSIFDDNYVMSMLNGTDDSKALLIDVRTSGRPEFTENTASRTATDFPDTLGKHLINEIMAEENDLNLTDSVVDIFRLNGISALQHISFAPITILNKPERPDNWVNYDSPMERPLLPELPLVDVDTWAADEVPKPITGTLDDWLVRYKQKLSEKTKDVELEPEGRNDNVSSSS